MRVHVKAQAEAFERLGKRYGARWTPTILVLDPSGEERHRIVGFLPAEEMLAQLALGLAHSAFARGELGEAELGFRDVADRHPRAEAAPEALYWAGVSRYKAASDSAALADAERQLRARYAGTIWAKKASVWSR